MHLEAVATLAVVSCTMTAGMCLGAEYHVAQKHPRAADDNPGTEERPWKTISRAADALRPGDTVVVHEGVYPESVTIGVSGAPDRPIVFEGERGPNGQWPTVVDRSIPVGGWTPAPEIGEGVYKTTQLDFAPYSMTLDDKLLARIRDDYMRDAKGFEYLTLAADAPNTDGAGEAISFWDGVEALYGHREGVTYIRFRNGDDPSDMDLKAAPAGGGFTITNKSHVVIRGFTVRGAQDAVVIEGEDAHDNVVEANRLLNGHNRVVIRDGASRNTVRDNEMTPDYFGYASPGAWGTDKPTKHTMIREHIYRTFKYVVGPNSSDDRGVLLRNAGEGNEVAGNHIHAGLIGVACGRAPKLRVHHNVIHNMSSIGILTSEDEGKGVHDGEFFQNLVYDCNINLRIHHYNTPRDNQRREFHYRNLFYQPEGLGNHIFVHWLNDQWPPETDHPEIWIYHNTFAGGRRAIQPSGWAVNGGGLRRTRFLNNVLSAPMFCYGSTDLIGRREMIGLFDCNWVGGVYHHGVPAWFGQHNVKAEGQQLWSHATLPHFRLSADSPARGKGVDLSKPFALEGEIYDPLPGIKPGYFTGPAPDVGALQYGEKAPVDLRIAALAGKARAEIWPLRVSDNGHYLVSAEGTPFIYLADTAWGMFQYATAAEAKRYMDIRAEQGFTVVFAPLVFKGDEPPMPGAGDAFTVPFHGWRFTRPNNAYFDRCRDYVRYARRKGLTVCMMPVWHSRWHSRLRALDDGDLKEFGRYFGREFGAHDNIIWCLGGDFEPDRSTGTKRDQEVVSLIAEGIADRDPEKLMTFHPRGGDRSSEWFHHAPWLDFNMYQSKDPNGRNQYEYALLDYRLEPARPTVQGEFSYEYYLEGEHWPPIDPLQIRRSAYWSLLRGAMGYTYGRRGVWHFNAARFFDYQLEGPWHTLMDSPGARHMTHFARFLSRYPWQKLAPDAQQQFAIGGVGEGTDITTAALASDGSFGVAYFPKQKTTTFDLRRLRNGSRVKASWYDPTDGRPRADPRSPFDRLAQAFRPPGRNSAGDADWLLILESTNQPGKS